ncbi:MAG: PQQ-binding-like beta-propeller repeat protein [Candidatus Bathyarchaeota archaeon]|nr:PQQ-binding-like beta-propeller repeat protein [Candidatus Bathyarchaeota archaeon]
MEKILNLKKLSVSVLILMLAVSGTMMTLPASAQTEDSPFPTNAYLTVSPNPVGVNQQVTFLMWLVQIEPTASGPQGGRWEDFTLLITKPDGTTETLGPFTADDASYAHALYNPDKIGTYTVTFDFPGKHVTGVGGIVPIPVDSYYAASSFTLTLTVQQEPVVPTPQNPLPTGFWSRPINAQNQEWYTISGNWLGTGAGSFGTSNYDVNGNVNLYTTVPDTAHVVWTKPLVFGGLIGGQYGGTATSNYYNGKSYEPAFGPPIIINGVLYYNDPATPRLGFYAVDLQTGETLWHQNGTTGITTGQVYNFLSPNQQGGIPYLWYMSGTTWNMYDAVRGNLILQITNATSGTTVEGPNGELTVYVLDATNNRLAMWNSSKCLLPQGPETGMSNQWLWRPQTGATIDWQTGIQWNVTTQSYPGQSICRINSGVILATTGSFATIGDSQMEIGYDATTGQQLWVQNRTLFGGATSWGLMGAMADGIYAEFHSDAMQWYGYDAYTGEHVWGPSEAYTNAWGSMAMNDIASESAYGILFGFSVDGIHALDIQTGEKLWDFYADPSGADFPGYSTLPFETNMLFTVADGKVIASTGDSHGVPLYRGARLYVVDVYSGEEVWSVNGCFEQSLPVADGYLVGFNLYDNLLYCFGKGQTATTVTAPNTAVPKGTPVLIQGTITDQSPGETCLGVPTAGTPAVSDDCMSAWMEYLYMQQPKPTDVTGVEVHLTAVDPNGNTQEIGTVTSDIKGNYKTSWTPPVEGIYTIIAEFAGTESYYSSDAETGLVVSSAGSAAPVVTSPSPSPAVQPPASSTQTTTYIAIAAEIVIIAVAAAIIVLRKRK